MQHDFKSIFAFCNTFDRNSSRQFLLFTYQPIRIKLKRLFLLVSTAFQLYSFNSESDAALISRCPTRTTRYPSRSKHFVISFVFADRVPSRAQHAWPINTKSCLFEHRCPGGDQTPGGGGSDAPIPKCLSSIAGGTIRLNGIDSNGNLYVSAGAPPSTGPTSDGRVPWTNRFLPGIKRCTDIADYGNSQDGQSFSSTSTPGIDSLQSAKTATRSRHQRQSILHYAWKKQPVVCQLPLK